MERAARRELQALLTRLGAGDRSAFHPVFEIVRPIVERFAARALPSHADAEDVAQEALVKIFARASDFDPEREALPWILSIAAFEIRTAQRRRERRRESPNEDAMCATAEAAPSPEARAIDRDLLAALGEALGAMRPEDAEVILASAEVIERPSIAPATLRKRLQRAMVRLRAVWSDET
jgi:RNA polymerase sigma-70 factor (ECF subfamily)